MILASARRVLDRAWIPAVVAVLACSAFVSLRVESLGDSSLFVTAGDRFVDASAVPGDLKVIPHSAGYDGQFYFRLAVDPATRSTADHGVTFDYPAYRHQRILTPLLAGALSLGEPSRVPEALIVLNVLALGAVAGLGALVAQRFGRHALWGLAVAGFPGFALTVARDLTECVAAAFLLAGLLLLARDRRLLAGVALALAALARETTLIVVAPLAVQAIAQVRRRGLRALLDPAVAVPAGVVAAWQAALTVVWREVPLLSGPPNLGFPVVSMVRGVWRQVETATAALDLTPNLLQVLDLIVVAAVFVAAALVLRRSAAEPHEKAAYVLAVALVTTMQPILWAEEFFLRAMTEPYLLSAVVLLGARVRTPVPLLPLVAGSGLWAATAAYRIDVV